MNTSFTSKSVVRLVLAGVTGLLLSPAGRAAEAASQISRVTVYPGTAVVERTARVTAGTRELVLNCLSTGFDMATLRVEADAGVRVGPVTATTRLRAEVPGCTASPLDGRIQALEDRIAALDAELEARELVLTQLKGDVIGGAGARGSTSALASALALVQRTGLEMRQQQHRLRRDRAQIEQELIPLKAERERQQPQGEVRQLVIQLQATADAELRLHYQVPGPTWAPTYRATLGSAALESPSASVEMERLAQVSQASGEDWSGVALKLSTGSPQAATSGPQPRPWRISPQPPVVAREAMPVYATAPAPAPLAKRFASAEAAPLDFAVQVTQGEFATEFEVPGRVEVRSGGQSVAFSLGTARWPAEVRVQTVPDSDPSAWIVAEVARPEGVWPDGSLQLLRGTQVVGRTVWRSGGAQAREKITLSFGRDELVRVLNLPPTSQSATTGFISARSERRISRLYEVENRHRTPVALEVLESGPVGTDAQISVTRQFEPAPQPGDWNGQPGVIAWRQTLGAGRKTRFGAEYLISHPKDMPVIERR